MLKTRKIRNNQCNKKSKNFFKYSSCAVLLFKLINLALRMFNINVSKIAY